MATVTICDRCKKQIEPKSTQFNVGTILSNLGGMTEAEKKYAVEIRYFLEKTAYAYSVAEIDLCKYCFIDSITEFLEAADDRCKAYEVEADPPCVIESLELEASINQ